MRKIFIFVFVMMDIISSFATTPDISANTTTVSCADSALNTNTGPANIEINWEPNTINLHWYDGNTELSVPTASQSCVYDGGLVLPSPPSLEGYTFKGWRVKDVPYGYTQLQYIETTGTQYIRTPYGINALTESDNGVFDFSVDIQFTNVDNRIVFGYALNSDTYWGTSGARQTKYAQALHGTYSLLQRHTLSVNTVVDINADKVISNTIKVIINGEVAGHGTSSRSDKVPAGVLRVPQETATSYPSSAKIYGLIQHQRGNLVFRGIPAKRNSDNVVGMWDTVSKTFFENAGTGSFIAGPNAP